MTAFGAVPVIMTGQNIPKGYSNGGFTPTKALALPLLMRASNEGDARASLEASRGGAPANPT